MVFRRNGGRGFRGARFGLSFIEASLALSVIAGLLFVTLRIMNMPYLAAQPDTAVVTSEPPALASNPSENKTP